MQRIFCFLLFVLWFCFPWFASSKNLGPLPSQSPSPNRLKVLSTTPEKNIAIGTWVEYAVNDRNERKNYRMKIAFVGRENNGRHTWVEIALTGIGRPIYLKLLMEGAPGSPGEIKRLIMQAGDMQPMEMPLVQTTELLPMLPRKPLVAPQVVGNVDLRTPAGMFPQSLHIRGVNADGEVMNFYHHPQALMWTLVKLEDARFTMELVGQGTGAVSRIRQMPVPFRIPQ